MSINIKLKTSCPVCHKKTRAVKITPFLKICPKCSYKIN